MNSSRDIYQSIWCIIVQVFFAVAIFLNATPDSVFAAGNTGKSNQTSAFAGKLPYPVFTDATASAGLQPTGFPFGNLIWGDFDGDGKCDLAVFRPSTGQWYLRKSSGSIQISSWGLTGDVPVTGDYDGDAIDDLAVFRPADGVWYIVGSSTGIVISSPWGLSNDQPVPKYDTP